MFGVDRGTLSAAHHAPEENHGRWQSPRLTLLHRVKIHGPQRGP